MKIFNCRKKEFSPYTELDEGPEGFIMSLKERQMRRLDWILTVFLTGALVVCVCLIAFLTTIMADSDTSDVTPFANSVFASRLYDVLRKTEGNVFFSPYSLQVALAMVYTGASGPTAQQIQKSVAFTENRDVLYKAVEDTTNALTSNKDVILKSANALYVQQNYHIKESYTNKLKGVFKAEAKELNFSKSAEAAKEINNFVNEKTYGKITELFSQDDFNSFTRLVLVNAVYFKGAWVNKFDPKLTYKGDFHLNNKDTVKVDFMKISKKFNAVEDSSLRATIVELPYVGELNMVLVVPNEIEGIKQLEENLKNVDLKTLTQQAYSREVDLTLPKFKLEQKIDLNQPLKDLGIVDMFDQDRAEFSGITDSRELYVSKVVQKSFIDVNEEGSEAAAATGVKFLMRMMPIPPMTVTANRPFLFFLTHEQGPLLFCGRFSVPQ